MVETDVLFRLGHDAEEAGDLPTAVRNFQRGAILGDTMAMTRLAYMYDVGLGVAEDKSEAMRLYRRAWRMEGNLCAANNIAILYRERGNRRAMFQWFRRAAERGDGDADLDLAKCYLRGLGVRRDGAAGLRHLRAAIGSDYVTEANREEAQALLDQLAPRLA